MLVAAILWINYAEIMMTWANEPSIVLAFTNHISLDIYCHSFSGIQFIDFFYILAIFI